MGAVSELCSLVLLLRIFQGPPFPFYGVNFCWQYRKEHFVEDRKISKTRPV